MVSVERREPIGWILLGSAVGVHTIGESFPTQLETAVAELSDASEVRAVVLAGRSKVFCAGADLGLADRLREPRFGRRWLETQHRALLALARMPMPTVASVSGAAFGAGFNLALACDFLLAARSASFCQAFVKVGLATDMGSPYLLPRRVGLQRARELMYTGRTIDADEAFEIGVVDELADSDVDKLAEAMAARLAAGPPLALAAMKKGLARAPGSTLEEVLDDELELQVPALRSEDFSEGARAFDERRNPQFRGR